MKHVTCNRCGETGLGWDKTAKGAWALRQIMRDAKVGEVLGAWHRCEHHEAVKAQIAEADAAIAALPEQAANKGETAAYLAVNGYEFHAREMARAAAHDARAYLRHTGAL